MNPYRGIPAASQSVLDSTRHAAHSHCLLCGAENAQGLGLHFQTLPDGSVRAAFAGSARHEGYPETLHGGLIAALLDSAMTNCLFARGVIAVTARLNVRYLRPGRVGRPMEVMATLARSNRSLHYLDAEVRQAGGIVATASATFKDRTPEPVASRVPTEGRSSATRSTDDGPAQEH
jgi:uncharacterized protein (TIGR00369 family)